MKVIAFILALTLSLVANAAGSAVYVVKILNFACPVCKAHEAIDAQLELAARATGGTFVWAPIPIGEPPFESKDLFYYNIKKYGRSTEERIRMSLYKGAQDMGLLFEDIAQVVSWLQQDITTGNIGWGELATEAINSAEAKQSKDKALALAVRTGVDYLPAYVLIVNGEPVAMFDPSRPDTSKPLLLKDAVLSKIKELSK